MYCFSDRIRSVSSKAPGHIHILVIFKSRKRRNVQRQRLSLIQISGNATSSRHSRTRNSKFIRHTARKRAIRTFQLELVGSDIESSGLVRRISGSIPVSIPAFSRSNDFRSCAIGQRNLVAAMFIRAIFQAIAEHRQSPTLLECRTTRKTTANRRYTRDFHWRRNTCQSHVFIRCKRDREFIRLGSTSHIGVRIGNSQKVRSLGASNTRPRTFRRIATFGRTIRDIVGSLHNINLLGKLVVVHLGGNIQLRRGFIIFRRTTNDANNVRARTHY